MKKEGGKNNTILDFRNWPEKEKKEEGGNSGSISGTSEFGERRENTTDYYKI